MGTAIINAISSGLGLASELAGEFLSAFGTLFWDPTANSNAGALTTFGVYACVMLGISVCFACITTVVSLVRSNTGV